MQCNILIFGFYNQYREEGFLDIKKTGVIHKE